MPLSWEKSRMRLGSADFWGMGRKIVTGMREADIL